MTHTDLPLHLGVEKQVVTSLLTYPQSFPTYADRLQAQLFTNPKYKALIEVFHALYLEGVEGEVIALMDKAKKMKLSSVLNQGDIIELISTPCSSANLERNIFILIEYASRRQFILDFQRFKNIAKDESSDIVQLRDEVMTFIDHTLVNQTLVGMKSERSFASLTDEVWSQAQKRGESIITGVYNSLPIIQKALGGFQKTNLTIVAARPAMGKTSFMVQCMVDALLSNRKVGVFSLEMSDVQIATKVITNLTHIPNYSFLRKGLREEDVERFKEKEELLKSLPLHINDTPALSIQDLRVKAKAMKLQKGIEILFVDYLQLIKDKSARMREQEISNISQGLKAIAKELDIPVVALSQLSRQVEQRIDKRPLLSDLRESGAIEQDADEVLFLYRPQYYHLATWEDGSSTENTVEVIIAKNRQGGILSERNQVDMKVSQFFV